MTLLALALAAAWSLPALLPAETGPACGSSACGGAETDCPCGPCECEVGSPVVPQKGFLARAAEAAGPTPVFASVDGNAVAGSRAPAESSAAAIPEPVPRSRQADHLLYRTLRN